MRSRTLRQQVCWPSGVGIVNLDQTATAKRLQVIRFRHVLGAIATPDGTSPATQY
jgi:hypothetical protein